MRRNIDKLLGLSLCLLLLGCNSVQKVGSRAWHENRLQEIESAYKDGKISTAEYIQLKNQADQVRATRKVAGAIASQ